MVVFGCSVPTGCGLRYALITLLSISAAQAQTVNIDFGPTDHTPPSSYAAAGVPGVWNTISVVSSTPTGGVVDVQGAATALRLSASNWMGSVGWLPSAIPMPEPDRFLVGDYIAASTGRLTLTIGGIAAGHYRLITYAVPEQNAPDEMYPISVAPMGDPSLRTQISGIWEGSLREGSTHCIHEIDIAADPFTLELTTLDDAWLNGLQLIQLPEPSFAAMLIPAAVFGKRRRVSAVTHR